MKALYQFKILFRRLLNELNPAAAENSSHISFFRIYKLFTTRRGWRKFKRLAKKMVFVAISIITGKPLFDQDYARWMKKNTVSEKELNEMRLKGSKLAYQPLISIVLPVYNSNLAYFQATIESIKNQAYINWQLCISDDASTDNSFITFLKELETEDKIDIVYRSENGHIAENSNSALEIAKGEFVAFIDHDDLLAPEALYEMVLALNEKPGLDIIYSDEDKIGPDGKRFEPYFKTGWAPDHLLARNYINHLLLIRKRLITDVGGFRKGFEGAQDHDLLLRVSEKSQLIHHIPKVLYHWRFHAESTANSMSSKTYAVKAGEKAITEAILRRGENAKVAAHNKIPGAYTIRYKLEQAGKVSIIIPTKDKAEVLKVCLESILNKTNYTNYEIILLDNNSTEESLFDLVEVYQQKMGERFIYYRIEHEFNFAYLMNRGVEKCTGDYIVLLNNDTELLTPDWLEALMEQSQRATVGAVGCKLLYPNDRIQHIGVLLGVGGVAGHNCVGKDDDFGGYFDNANLNYNYCAVTAACMMVRKSLFDEVGGFDENLAVEFNDVDFCLKLYDKGYFNIYIPHVVLYHYESLSRGHPFMTKESNARHLREEAYFEKRWKRYIDDDPYFNINFNRSVSDYKLNI